MYRHTIESRERSYVFEQMDVQVTDYIEVQNHFQMMGGGG
jgi:hypothetical protein